MPLIGKQKLKKCPKLGPLTLQLLFVCRGVLTGGTVIPVSLVAVVPTVLEKSLFCGYLTPASVSLRLPTQFAHSCLVTARAFMPASPIVHDPVDHC